MQAGLQPPKGEVQIEAETLSNPSKIGNVYANTSPGAGSGSVGFRP